MSQTYLFSESCIASTREIIFKSTPLGKLKEVLPLSSLVNLLPSKCNPAGAKPWFNPEGMLGLMFLKSYTELSDSFLIDQLNGNWHMQFFCGIQLADNEQIRDASIVSRIRSYIAKHIDLSVFQKDLVSTWGGEMDQTHLNMQDATVYESYIKYPTDVKLLWDCCEFLNDFYQDLNQSLNLKRGKHSFQNQQKNNGYIIFCVKRAIKRHVVVEANYSNYCLA